MKDFLQQDMIPMSSNMNVLYDYPAMFPASFLSREQHEILAKLCTALRDLPTVVVCVSTRSGECAYLN
jgi:hypothetical protein